jgi:hypothetical protein
LQHRPKETRVVQQKTPLGRHALIAFWLQSTVDESRNTGLAMVLICLLLAHLDGRPQWLPTAIGLLLLCMVWPVVFRPVARVWLGLSHMLGAVVSRIILSVLFYGLVTPVGLLRRMSGADSMQRGRWKADRDSTFITRNHLYRAKDLDRPY